jgi:type III secretion protein V
MSAKPTARTRSRTDPAVVVDLQLPVGVDEWPGRRADALTDDLRGRSADLLHDLGVPGDPQVTVRFVDPSGLVHADCYDVSIDGRPCRVDLSAPLDRSPAAMAARVADTLYYNRTLFATERLARSIAPDATNGKAVRLLARAFAQGLDVAAVRAVAQTLKTGGWNGPRWADRVDALLALHMARVITVELGRGQYDAVLATPQERIDEMLSMMRDGLFYELGIRFSAIRITASDQLADAQFQARINCLRGPVHEGLAPDEVLVNDIPDRLELLGVTARAATNPANDRPCALVAAADGPRCEQAGLTTWDAAGYVVLSLAGALRRHAAELFSSAQCETTLRRLDQAFPMPVFNVLERFALGELREVLQALLREGVSIRDLRSVLEALLETEGSLDVDYSKYVVLFARDAHPLLEPSHLDRALPQDLVESVRLALRRQITHQHTRGGSTIVAHLLSPELEERIVTTDTEPLSDAERRKLLSAIRADVHFAGRRAESPVVLTTVPVRRRLRALTELEFPFLSILSYNELAADVNIQPIGRITLD